MIGLDPDKNVLRSQRHKKKSIHQLLDLLCKKYHGVIKAGNVVN